MQEYKIDKKFFSVDDLSALLMGLSSLSSMVWGDEVAHVLAKVKSFIPAERAKDIALVKSKSNKDRDGVSEILPERGGGLFLRASQQGAYTGGHSIRQYGRAGGGGRHRRDGLLQRRSYHRGICAAPLSEKGLWLADHGCSGGADRERA